ncbi:MAG: glycosyltransferase family 4 protein [Prevotellaceae bacterium]|nr:glycosyltransferase family 4 protein [Prevotellaceae bacterium]
MNILLVNTLDRDGGAAIAASRLKTALLNLGEKARMLVACKQGDDLSVYNAAGTLPYRSSWLRERMGVFVRQGLSKAHLWEIDPASAGVDITSTPQFKEADIIHLHWINQGFLSMRSLRAIFRSGKPVVWTMHDMWPFTGLCHYAQECLNFENQCGHCRLLRRQGEHDWSHKVWQSKARLYENASNISFVACSKWLAELAQRSSLLDRHTVLDIPNPIDTTLFSPTSKTHARTQLGLPTHKKLILFSAYNVNTPIKGFRFLREACEMLIREQPALRDRIAIVCTGRGAEQIGSDMPVELCPIGYVTDPKRMAQVYNAADMLCIPSLQDNLPNTIVEAKACGVPAVGFAVGGIPQMISHMHDGYLARPQDAADLARGLRWLLTEADTDELARLNRTAAVSQYSESRVAERYIELYRQLIDNK